MANKLCIYCIHFDIEEAEYSSYSTLTGSDYSSGGTYCRLGHFDMRENPPVLNTYRQNIEKGLTCPDFVHIPKAEA